MARNKANQKGKIEKALKPSQRESITEFSTRFGSEPSYEERVKKRKIINAVLFVLVFTLIVTIGYFITDVLIKITELPYEPVTAKIFLKDDSLWISSLTIQG